MDDRVYDAAEEKLGDMVSHVPVLRASPLNAEESDSVANETAEAGAAFGRIIVEKADVAAN